MMRRLAAEGEEKFDSTVVANLRERGYGGKWPVTQLSDLTEAETPVTYGVVKPGDEDTEGVLFIRGGDIADGRILTGQLRTISNEISRQYKRTLLRGGEILMSLVGNPGQVAIVPESLRGANIARQAALIRLRPDVDTRFVRYFLGSYVGQEALRAHSRGSVQQVINLRDLKTVGIPTPPLPEQRFIAHILGTLDDKIELNRRMNETLEAMARALFKSWFVDFDPVRAKADQNFEDSEIGQIPKGWRVRPVGDLAEIVGGSTPSTKDPSYWEGGTHQWVTPKDLSTLAVPVLLDTERRITDAGLGQISSGLLPTGTVLLSSRAPIGYLAVAEVPVALNQGFIAMKPKHGISNLFLLLWARHAHDEIVSRANGSTFLEISKSNFRPIPIAAPPDETMDAFDKIARPLYQRIVMCARECLTLAHMRDTLLPKLISGELRVKDAERQVEAVA
jgi:type I restriction enzyme S subunit